MQKPLPKPVRLTASQQFFENERLDRIREIMEKNELKKPKKK